MLTKRTTVFVIFALIVCAALYYFLRAQPYNNSSHSTSLPKNHLLEAIEWKEYVSQNPSFQILLPTVPQHAQETVALPTGQGVIKYDLYLSQAKSGTTFMISVIEYPKEYVMSNSESLLDGVLKEMLVGNNMNKLTHSKKGIFQSCPSVDFSLQSPEIATISRAFVKDQSLYVLTTVDKMPADIEGHFKVFADSFKVNQ